jgi:hypothetical protein
VEAPFMKTAKPYDLRREISTFSLTAHSCINKVSVGMQSAKAAHAEIRADFERIMSERKRKVRP